jgi:hypothetical protein
MLLLKSWEHVTGAVTPELRRVVATHDVVYRGNVKGQVMISSSVAWGACWACREIV